MPNFINSGGSSTFISQTDTPTTYVGQAGLIPAVNVGETALEFVAPGASSGVPVYTTGILYTIDQVVEYRRYLWKANQSIGSAPAVFDFTQWDLLYGNEADYYEKFTGVGDFAVASNLWLRVYGPVTPTQTTQFHLHFLFNGALQQIVHLTISSQFSVGNITFLGASGSGRLRDWRLNKDTDGSLYLETLATGNDTVEEIHALALGGVQQGEREGKFIFTDSPSFDDILGRTTSIYEVLQDRGATGHAKSYLNNVGARASVDLAQSSIQLYGPDVGTYIRQSGSLLQVRAGAFLIDCTFVQDIADGGWQLTSNGVNIVNLPFNTSGNLEPRTLQGTAINFTTAWHTINLVRTYGTTASRSYLTRVVKI